MVYNTCCACGRKIVQSERNEDACDTCGKVLCRSCLTLKSKLEMTASQRRQKSCVCQRFMDMKDCRSPVAESDLKDITQKCDTPNDTSNGVSLFVKDKVEAIVSPDYETDRKTEIMESSDGARSSSSYRVDSSRKKIDAYSSPGRKWLAVVNKSASIPDTAVPQKPLQSEQLFTPGEIYSLQAGEDTLESSDPEQPSATSVPEKEVVLDLPYLELLHTPGNNDWFQLANGAFESSYHEHLLAPDSIDSFHVPDDTWESPPNEWLNAFGNIEVEDTFDSLHNKGLDAQNTVESFHLTKTSSDAHNEGPDTLDKTNVFLVSQDIVISSQNKGDNSPVKIDSLQMPRDLFEVSHHEKLDALESLKLQHSSVGCTVESVEEIRAEIAPSHTKSLDSNQVIHTMGSLEGTDVDQGFWYCHENKVDAKEEAHFHEIRTQDSRYKNQVHADLVSTKGEEHTAMQCTTFEGKQPSQIEKPSAHRHVDKFGGLHGLLGQFLSEKSFENLPPRRDLSKTIASKETENDDSMKKDRTHLQTDTSEDSLGAVRGLSQNSASKLSFENTPSIADTSINEKTSISETKDSANHGETKEVAFSPLFGSGGLNGHEENYASKSSQTRIYPRIHRSERNETLLSDASPHGKYSQEVSAHTSTPLHENPLTRKGQLYGIERDLFGGESDINHDDIPAFSDIPYALLLCNVYNEKELNIAIEKQQQKNILTDIKRQRQHLSGNDAAHIETKHQNRFLFSPKQETHTPTQAASKVSESGKMKMSNLKQTSDTVNFDPNKLLYHNVPDISVDENNFQSEFWEKRKEQFAKTKNTQNSSYGKQFPLQTCSVKMPTTDKCIIQTKAEISSTTDTALKSASNQNGSPIKTSLEERVTSNGTKFNRKMSPTISIAMDDNLPSSNLINCFESSQSTLISPKTYKEERTPTYTHLPTNDKRVSVNTDKTQAKVPAHSQELSKSISETHDLEKGTNPDDGDDVDERDLPTAVKAFLISQGKRNPQQKDGDINISIIIRQKQSRKSRHHDNTSIQSTENVTSNELSLQSNDSREHDVLSQQSVHFEDKPEFMLKAERDVSERSETYARAFDALRTQQSSKKIKCIVCGNPDCQGDFIQNIQGLMHEARKQGLVVNDVPPDGNCMFTAVCDQLQTYKDLEYTARTLRETAVFWLQANPYCSDDSNTHFQAFMTENWDSYLQRMIKEGEWGDHVILRAVANITGRKIKILSVNGKTSSWTSVEPSSKQQEQLPAILLGHVGESHYTSLRHNDSPEENVSTALIDEKSTLLVTGDEDHTLVASFLKDHVDIESKVPMCCLSFLMTSVLPSKTLVDGAARMSSTSLQNWTQIANTTQRNSSIYQTMITGSIADGIYNSYLLDLSDNPDVMYIWMDLKILYVCPVTERFNNYRLIGHGTLCSAGNTYILDDKNEYEYSEKYSAYTFAIPTDDNSYVYAFYVIHWPYWPQEASEWIKRVRYVGWPPEEVIHDISSLGCHLIPEAHVSSTEPFKEWKFCFAAAQTRLFRNAISVHQKYCFLVVTGMCFEVLHSLLFFKLEWIINPFFYCCERCPSEFWEGNYAACVTMIIDEIRHCFTLKYLPNYFIPACNMIGTLGDSEISAVVENLENLRAEPLFALRQMDENFKAIPDAETIFSKVKTAADQFLSSKISTLNVFVPCMIDFSKNYINNGCYDLALESMNEAYQTRLSVATCEDAMSYEIFIQGCFSGLTTTGKIWFATYVDKQLQGQLSRTLIQQVMEGCPMKQICEILEKDISGYYGSSEVPVSMANHFDNFCHDYAMFLVLVHKVSEALPILYHCHTRYQHYLKTGDDFHKFSDETMLAVYAGIFALHKRKQHTDVFREILEDASSTVARVNQSRGYTWLAYVHRMFNNENEVKTNEEKREELRRQLPPGHRTQNYAASLIWWPRHYIM